MLAHLDLEANSVLLKNGRLIWPLPGTNQPQRTFNLTDAGGELIFKKGDAWELKYLEADILGTHVRFRGDITNASLIRDWKLPSAPARPDARPEDLWQLNESSTRKKCDIRCKQSVGTINELFVDVYSQNLGV